MQKKGIQIIIDEFTNPTAIDNYVVPSLKLDDGTFVFSYLATFLSFITPHDLPIGKREFFIILWRI